MKKITNDYCIRMFVGSDLMRQTLTKVSFNDGFLYATDANIAAKVNSSLCVKDYVAVEKYPNVESVISEHKSSGTKIVSVDSLFNDLMHIECCFKPKMIRCSNCNGDGTSTCDHCNSEYDCKECKGNGEVPGKELELTSLNSCQIFGKKYNVHYLDLIIKTAVYTGVKEIEISNAINEHSGTIFIVGDFTILLMPMVISN